MTTHCRTTGTVQEHTDTDGETELEAKEVGQSELARARTEYRLSGDAPRYQLAQVALCAVHPLAIEAAHLEPQHLG